MSCLKIYAPDDSEVGEEQGFADPFTMTSDADSEPEILSWRIVADRFRNPSLMEVLARTRVIYRNRRCRSCDRPTVEPVELDDAVIGKSRLPVPGTGTLVGFCCQYCRHQWRL